MPILRIIFLTRNVLAVMVLSCGLFLTSNAKAEISVVIGPTTIPRGNATGAGDITISNDLFAIAFAVDTVPPWGIARGGIVDIAIVRDGKPGYDIASLADFLPNGWSSWATTYQRVVVQKQTAMEAIVRTERDWGEVELVTVYQISDGDNKIHMVTHMTNKSDSTLNALQSGYVVWPDGGYVFGVPGLAGVRSGDEDGALADWSAAYDADWALGLHAPYAEIIDYGGRDRYLQHDLLPGETRSFEAWLQIENAGTLAPMVQAEIGFRHLEYGQIAGRVVSDEGDPVEQPVIVVLRKGEPYAWTVGGGGAYVIQLPVGQYEMYATANGYARGSSRTIVIAAGSKIKQDFRDVQQPGALKIKVVERTTGQALDARISIQSGYRPLVQYLGKNTYFTELHTVGETTISMAPGTYELQVSAGAGFLSMPRTFEIVIASGGTHELKAEIAVTAMPRQHGWYSADLHHHSDVLDGFTEAEFVLRSELAAGVDITFLSDHDSVVNNNEMRVLSSERGMRFIPGTELSPSWAHFNAYPLDDGKIVSIDTGQAPVQAIFEAARGMGADIIAVNHPYSGNGYFRSLEQTVVHGTETSNAVPGGYDAGFDLVEITSEDNAKTIHRVWQMWNEGQRAYLAAGSDVHDVWAEVSGSARSYVHIDGDLTIERFIDGLKAGHAFASQGPLVYPELLFGSEVCHAAGEKLVLAYSVMAVAGLRSVQLVERGTEVDSRTFDGGDEPVEIEFSVSPESDTWYSLVVEDMRGKFAYTNPLWVMASK